MSAAMHHLSIQTLLDYWLGDSDAGTTEAADEHLMHCEACGQALDELMALGDGVRTAFQSGVLSAVSSDAFVQHLAAQGRQIREYRLPHNGSVNCTVAPGDELLVTRLQAPLQGVERLDAVAVRSLEPGVQRHLQDIPFDPQAGEVVMLPKIAEVKTQPAYTLQITLLAVASGGTREVGRYTFRHRPWPGA